MVAGYFDSTFSPDLTGLNQHHDHWVNVHMEDEMAGNINILELIPVWLAMKRSAPKWKNSHVICYTDNSSVKFMVNKGSSSSKYCMVLLRDLFWICAKNNIHLTARHVSGVDNVLADLLSRLIFTNNFCTLKEFSLCCSENIPHRGFG